MGKLKNGGYSRDDSSVYLPDEDNEKSKSLTPDQKRIHWESYKGGEGSGNFGHEGRPGEVGGSASGGGGGSGGDNGDGTFGNRRVNPGTRNFKTADEDYKITEKETKVKGKIDNNYNLGQQMREKYNGDLTQAIYSEDLDAVFYDPIRGDSFDAGWNGRDRPELEVGWRYGQAPESGVSYNYRDNRAEKGISMMATKSSGGILSANPDRTYEMFNAKGQDIFVYRGFRFGNGSDGEPIIKPTTHLDTIKTSPSSPKSKSLTPDQKRIHWEAYARKTERQEEVFKKVFDALFNEQKDLIVERYEKTGKLPELDDGDTAKKFEPAIELIYHDGFEDALPGKSLKQLDDVARQWILTRSLKLAKLINLTTLDDLKREIAAGLETGESTRQIAKRLEGYFIDNAEYRANMIARTETIAANNAAAQDRYAKEGIEKKEWLAAPDARESHLEANGQIVGINEDFKVGAGSGPGPGQIGLPEEDCNCRCQILPYFD